MSSSVSELMRSLVKRYNIQTRSPLAQTEQQPVLIQNNPQQISSAGATQQHKIDALLQKLQIIQRENDALRENLKEKQAELSSKGKTWALSEEKWMEKEKNWEANSRDCKLRITQLQTHNEALQQELLSIKDLLRDQQALIIQLNASQEEDD